MRPLLKRLQSADLTNQELAAILIAIEIADDALKNEQVVIQYGTFSRDSVKILKEKINDPNWGNLAK